MYEQAEETYSSAHSEKGNSNIEIENTSIQIT